MKKIFKRGFAAVTAVVIAFTAVFVFEVPKATVASAATVSDFAALKNAIASGGTITITSDITFTSGIEVTNNVTIKSQGAHTIKRGSSFNGYLFSVSGSGNLTFDGSSGTLTVDGGAVWSGTENPVLGRGTTSSRTVSGGLVAVEDNAVATLKSGTVFQNNCSNGRVKPSDCTLKVNNSGILNIEGSVIRNNKGRAGAIATYYNSTLNITSGEIYGNYGDTHGGVMQIFGQDENNSSVIGMAKCNISGGSIHNNLTTGVGGAIAVSDYSSLSLSGNAEIYGNKTTDYSKRGGGVGFIDSNTTLNISGNVKIYDNLDSSDKANNLAIGTKNNIIKLGTLSSGAKIGVTYNPGSVNTSSSFAETNSTDYSSCFFSDKDGYFVQYKNQGLYLTKACTTHSWNSGTVTTPATCTSAGVKTYTCTTCGATKTEDIDATGHSWGTEWSTDNSQHWHKCSVCGEKKDEAEHSWDICFPYSPSPGTYHVFKCSVCGSQRSGYFKHSGGTATCTSKAVCEYCGREYGSLAAHTTTHTAFKAATCTVDGNKEYWYCSTCKKYFSDSACTTEITDTLIKRTGHNSNGNIPHKNATCTENGVVGGTYCTNCGNGRAAAEAVITRLGHSRNDGEITKAPTCTETGVKTYTCTRCGVKETEEIVANGHNSEGSVPHVDATCTADGVVGGSYCTVCNDGKAAAETVIPATGHKFGSDWKHDGTRHWHECVNTGCTEKSDISVHTFEYETDDAKHWEKCTVCGCAKDAEAHVWGAWTLTQPPTMTAAGTAKHTCSICGYEQTESVPALTDTNVWTKDNNKHIDPTEEAEGKDVYTSEYGEVTVVIPELEHVHNNLTHVDEVPATETTEGVKEHWHCRCGKDFLDEDGTQEATADDLRIGKIQKEVQAPENVPKTEIATSGEDLINATLTEEDKNEVQQGKDIKIILKVEDATESASEDDKTAVTEELSQMSRYNLGQYLDVTLLKQIGDEQQKITTTSALIKITFEILSAFRGKPKYSVIRVHEGVAIVLDDLDSDPNTVTIKTDKFSTYALTYQESVSSGGSSGGSSSSDPSTSNTSEDTSSDVSDDTSDNTSSDISDDTSSDTSSDTPDDTSSNTSSDTSKDTSDDSSSETLSGDDISSEINPSNNNKNPSTGIAISFVSLVAILSGVIVVINRKKK